MTEGEDPTGMMIKNKFQVGEKFAAGSFGRVHYGLNVRSKEKVAIKMELKANPRPQLLFEYRFYKILNAENEDQVGIPKIHCFAPCGDAWHALVMDLLGASLEKVHRDCGSIFTLKTVLMLALQLIKLFNYFHDRGLVYRDMKPENFMFGQPSSPKWSTLHIIDLGLSKEYKEDGRHIEMKTGKGTIGTIRYMSINSHKGIELSRRDDMQALAYMLLFLLKGELPWQGAPGNDANERRKNVCKIKEKTKPEDLCAGQPREWATFVKQVMDLKFDEKPDYKGYIKLMTNCLERNKLKDDGKYDFDKNHRKIN